MYGKPAKKSLGQHFLHDAYFLNQMLHYLAPLQEDAFVEIGPGSGCLTDHLVNQVGHLTAIELDRDCVAHLKKKYEDLKHISIVEANFLTFDCHQLAEHSAPFRWVGNLPYNVSVPILLKLLDHTSLIQDALFLVQKEVSQRCCAQVGEKHYGRLGIVLQCAFSVSHVCEVPPEAFSPPPKVDSAMFVLKPLVDSKVHYLKHSHFSEVLIRCFSHRRKTMRKIFQGVISDAQWEVLGIDSQLRPEMIHRDLFYRIACCLSDHKE